MSSRKKYLVREQKRTKRKRGEEEEATQTFISKKKAWKRKNWKRGGAIDRIAREEGVVRRSDFSSNI